MIALFGIFFGVSGYTFYYAEGASYMSNDPKACVNCHIMREQYDGWLKSTHHTVATCNDCHVPASGVSKWISKAENGYHHSSAFTFQNFHEPIRISQRNAVVLQDNCMRCHADLVSQTGLARSPHGDADRDRASCVHCHTEVGHGARER